MGLVDRVRRITAGRIEAFLDSLEDPAAMIPLLLRELEDQSEVLARAEAKARSAVKAAQRRLNEETGHVARLGRGAELALRFGEEHTAREALARQVVAERSVRAAEENLAQADKALQDAREVRSGILRQQDDLRRRAAEFQQRGTHAAQGHTALAADPDSPDTQSTGMGLLGLRLGRDLVPGEVRSELLYGKFHNPMLGLIGAHLLLMAAEPKREYVDMVLGNLRWNLLGDVPDVRALEWRAWQRLGGDRPPQAPFIEPPMLRAGLRAVIDADAEVGGLVPADGILSWISLYQRADSAWTTWSPPVQVHAEPRPERTARPYLLPDKWDLVFLETAEDPDMHGAEAGPSGEIRLLKPVSFARRIALRGHVGLGESGMPGITVGRPLDGLRRHLDSLPLDNLVNKSLARPTDAEPASLGPSLSVALPEDQAAPADDSGPDWIDNLVKEALDSARRTKRDLDVAGLARAANLPRAMIEARISAIRD